jgi:hypothetical protein
MYRVAYADAALWVILDANEKAIFAGTKQQVEDWLDHRENVERQPSPRISLRCLWQFLLRMVRRSAKRQIGESADVPGAAAPQAAENAIASLAQQV